MKSKREIIKKNQDTNLRSSIIYLHIYECGYILLYDLALCHNIFIRKF